MKQMRKRMHMLIDLLEFKKHIPEQKNCCIGFDGYVDEILRVVQNRKTNTDCDTFKTINEFSDRIKAASGRSASIEFIVQEIKLGGNAPIMANALASMGFNIVCMGSMGRQKIHNIFSNMPSNCTLISVGDPAYNYAFEFDDGKLMFENTENIRNLGWDEVKASVGIEKIKAVCEMSSLFAITNWSAMSKMNEVIEGLIKEVFYDITSCKTSDKYVFFDIADPSSRSKGDIQGLFRIIKKLNSYAKVILGLNEKEAIIVHRMMNHNSNGKTLRQVGEDILYGLGISVLVIHTLDRAIGITYDEVIEVESLFVQHPKISTGGGDNFNGGFCAGHLMGLTLEHSLMLGNAASSYYVSHGCSPDLDMIRNYLKHMLHE